MRAVYLTGETLYMRGMQASDKEYAAAWYDSPFPINATRAEEFLKEAHGGDPRFGHRTLYFAICRLSDDEIAGGVKVLARSRDGELTFHFAPWLDNADELRAEALRVLVPWMRDERELLIVTVSIRADQPATRAAAEEVGLRSMVRLRDFIAVPGGRVDLHWYQWFHPSLETETEEQNHHA